MHIIVVFGFFLSLGVFISALSSKEIKTLIISGFICFSLLTWFCVSLIQEPIERQIETKQIHVIEDDGRIFNIYINKAGSIRLLSEVFVEPENYDIKIFNTSGWYAGIYWNVPNFYRVVEKEK